MFELKNFRTVAMLEATTFLILLLASVLKRAADMPVGVQIMGPIHGALFLVYVVLALGVRKQAAWGLGTTLLVLLGAVLPFGGYVVDRKLVDPAMRRQPALTS
jgi:integral membrane protein